MKTYLFIAVPLFLLGSYFLLEAEEKPVMEKQKGVCWVGSPQPIGDSALSNLKPLGITWISQTPFAWQQSPTDSILYFESNDARKGWWGESIEGIAITTQYAKQHQIKTILKPHIWLRQSWPGEIEMTSEQAWKAWFTQYERFILSYATLAEIEKIETLCIGTELQKTVHRKEWFGIIKKVRSIYRGKLTYAANFNEFEQVPFWSALDFIGIQAYFPLTKSTNPSVDELIQGWQQPLELLDELHKKIRKPIIFTEIGYKSTSDSAIEPWLWPKREDESNVSYETQANAYQAFFKACWSKPWLAGVYFWKWYPQQHKRYTAIDFTPQGKPAEQVLKKWFIVN